VQQRSEGVLLFVGQRGQEGPNGGKTPEQQLLAKHFAQPCQVKRDGALVASLAALDQAVRYQPIHQSHGSGVREAQNAPQLVVGRAKAIANDDHGGRSLSSVAQDRARGALDPVCDSKPDGAEQIGGSVQHRASHMCTPHIFQLDDMCAPHVFFLSGFKIPPTTAAERAMNDGPAAFLSSGHQDFFDRFKSFWAAPSGLRVPELIAPDATIHFTGAGTFSGHEYIDVMDGMLATMDDLVVTPLDCAGHGDRLYIAWETSVTLYGSHRTYLGVDRFRLRNGMAIEEQVIFDSAILQP
jgi:hypothetical protein